MKTCTSCSINFDSTDWQCPACHNTPQSVKNFLAFAPELAEINSGFHPDRFAELAAAEASNFWFRARNRLIIWALQQYFPQATNFLEIGCGTGFVLSGIERALPHLSLYGSEIYSAGLTHAARRLQSASLFQMDARTIPFAEEFDVIGAFDVLEHIEEDEVVLQQMHQAIVPGGGMLLTVPQHAFLWSLADEYACHVRRYEAQDLKQKVQRAGFVVKKITSFVSLLLPLMALSRLKQRKATATYDPMAELKIGGWINTILETVLSIEHGCIHGGISFPMGGSLLLVAYKL